MERICGRSFLESLGRAVLEPREKQQQAKCPLAPAHIKAHEDAKSHKEDVVDNSQTQTLKALAGSLRMCNHSHCRSAEGMTS